MSVAGVNPWAPVSGVPPGLRPVLRNTPAAESVTHPALESPRRLTSVPTPRCARMAPGRACRVDCR